MGKFGFYKALLLVVVLFTACSKDDDTAPPTPANPVQQPTTVGTMKADINGTPWVADVTLVTEAMPHGLSIGGQSNGISLAITINELLKPGKFNATVYESLSGWYIQQMNGTQHSWASITSKKCELEITKLDWVAKRMSGTFSFVADSQASSSPTGLYRVTNGVFTDIPITVAAPPASRQLTAQVDNVPYSASAVVLYGFPGYYYLNASNENGHALSITGIPSLQPGTYNASFGTYAIPSSTAFLYWLSEIQNPPVVTISSYDPLTKKASGTYSFTAQELPMMGGGTTKTVTQGTFTDILLY